MSILDGIYLKSTSVILAYPSSNKGASVLPKESLKIINSLSVLLLVFVISTRGVAPDKKTSYESILPKELTSYTVFKSLS